MAPCSANDVADFFLNFVHEHGDVLTNLKLQKLVYYAQAWHLALKNKPLFNDEIQAWAHGPVVPSLYQRFKKHRWDAIPTQPRIPVLSKPISDHLLEVFSVYGKFSAWDLERMTHQEEPWKKARKGLAPDEEGKHPISHQDMQDFYAKLAAKN